MTLRPSKHLQKEQKLCTSASGFKLAMQTPSSYCFCLNLHFNFSYTESVIIARENIDINTVTHLIVSYIIFI